MADDQGKIPIAIVCNSVPPYRLHVHRRIAREMSQVRLWTVRTHAEDTRWTAPVDDREIGLLWATSPLDIGRANLRSILRQWRLGHALTAWARRAGVRAVVLCGYDDLARIRLLLWCRWHRIPCLVSGDSNINDDRHQGLAAIVKRAVLSVLLRFCAAVLPFGTAGKLYFEKYRVPAERIFFFPLEPDYKAIQSLSEQAIADAGRQFALAKDRRRLLFCGRLISVKRVDLAIDAFCRIAGRRPLWDLVILGDGPLLADLKRRVPQNLAARVIWAGHIDGQRLVGAVQRCCDVLVLPSDQDRWALVINEALAAGMAVVSSTIPGAVLDLVHDRRNGRLFPPGNLGALEQCLLDVTDDQRLAAMKAESQSALSEWIRLADPIEGLRDALTAAGAIGPPSPSLGTRP